MKLKSRVILAVILFFSFLAIADAKMRKYSYPYDISQVEWQLLNWTAAWRGTTSPAGPFVLDRLECDRDGWIVNVYVTGTPDLATDENLKKSIDNITKVFQDKFPDFVAETDLIVHYNLLSADGNKVYKEYSAGSFNDGQAASQEAKSITKMKVDAATSY